MKIGMAELLKKVSEEPKKEKKIELLRKHYSPAFKDLMRLAFNTDVKWALPEGPPPYKPCPYLDQEGRLYTEIRRLYLFLEGGHPTLNQVKREGLFIALLESLAPADAELLISVKDKKLPYKGVNQKLFREAYEDF